MQERTASFAPCGCVAWRGPGRFVEYDPCAEHDIMLAVGQYAEPSLGVGHIPGVSPRVSWAERWAEHRSGAPEYAQYVKARQRAVLWAEAWAARGGMQRAAYREARRAERAAQNAASGAPVPASAPKRRRAALSYLDRLNAGPRLS